MDKDKFIDLLIAKNDSLEKLINQIQATIEQQREKSEELLDALRSQLQHMEEPSHSGRTSG